MGRTGGEAVDLEFHRFLSRQYVCCGGEGQPRKEKWGSKRATENFMLPLFSSIVEWLLNLTMTLEMFFLFVRNYSPGGSAQPWGGDTRPEQGIMSITK